MSVDYEKTVDKYTKSFREAYLEAIKEHKKGNPITIEGYERLFHRGVITKAGFEGAKQGLTDILASRVRYSRSPDYPYPIFPISPSPILSSPSLDPNSPFLNSPFLRASHNPYSTHSRAS